MGICSYKREASLVFHIQRSDFRPRVLVSKSLAVVACLLFATTCGHFVLRASIWSGAGIGVLLGLCAANALPAIFPSFKPQTRTWQVSFRAYRWLASEKSPASTSSLRGPSVVSLQKLCFLSAMSGAPSG